MASVNTGYEEAERRIEQARQKRSGVVYLRGLDLTEVPEAIGQLSEMRALDLSRNQISSLPAAIGQLSQLQELDLSHNKIASLPEAIGQLSQLQELDLSHNKIASLPEAIGQLSQLQELNLSRNQISSLPAALSQLKQLQGLNLSHNSISSLPAALSQLKQLQGLNLSNNPLDLELAAAYSQDTKTVGKFLAVARSPQVQSNEAKLILVGEGEVGKTTLLGALRGDPWVEGRETTHGIEIKPFTVKVPDSNTEIKLNGWDFGGQPVYRPTHQLFFSAPAVYLVVWKPRLGPQQAFVEYWITLVKRRAPEAKILVVATHCGPNSLQPHIDKQDIIQRFGSDTIQGFFTVDSKPDATSHPIGIDALKEAIARVAASLPEVGREVPAKWQQVREKLQATEKAYLSDDEVIDLCREQDMDPEEANLFLLISHKLGHLIHYHSDALLKKLVILKPDWLAKAISFVLDDAVTLQNEGLVDFSRLNLLWNNPDRQETDRYPKELHPTFRKLMERFDLSYRVVLDPSSPEPSYGSLIAQLVSDTRPTQLLEQNWGEAPKAGDKETQRICSIVDERGDSADAEGLFYQLIVRLHKYSLGRDDYRKSVHWKRGLLLDNSYNGRALLEHVGTEVRITVRAAFPEYFIYELTTEVKWLVEHFWEGLRCQVMVPCIAPCGKNEPGKGQFEVEKLIEYKLQGMPKLLCTLSGCNQWQEIDQLLRNDPAQVQDDPLDGKTKELKKLLEEMAKHIENQKEWIKQLNASQRELLSRYDLERDRSKRWFMDEAKDGPRLFNVQPIKQGFFDLPKWMGRKYQLTLWCEHSRLPLPALNPEGDKRGVYELELPRKWLVKAKPFLRIMARTLSVALKLPVPWIDFDIELKLDQVISGAIDQVPQQGPSNAPEWEARGEAVWAKGAMLRELHAILKKKDPSFGGLIPVQNKRHEVLWVHPQFRDEDEYR